MKIRLSVTALAVAAAFPALAQISPTDDSTLSPVVVTAARIEMPDVDAPYASEVHTRADIERSGATTLYDYLSRHASVTVLPSFGNRFSPKLDMRGYGVGDGHQNLVVSVDGRRLNNIDMSPQLLGAIPLSDVERIEITKGSGSVIFGDGAMAGTIQIYTRPRQGGTIQAYGGSHGAWGAAAAVGVVQERFSVYATADQSRHGGFSDRDPAGNRDRSRSETWRLDMSVQPMDRLELGFHAADARIDTTYPEPLTREEFRRDPGMNNGRFYTRQKYHVESWGANAGLGLSESLRLNVSHDREDKVSRYPAFNFGFDYESEQTDLALHYEDGGLAIVLGIQRNDGVRKDADSRTTKLNQAFYVQGVQRLERLRLSAGFRKERVAYAYSPKGEAGLRASERLNAWDVGANYRVSDAVAVFGNLNQGFQAPDVDRFFVQDFSSWPIVSTDFNGFIEPAKARTVTLGMNYDDERASLKLAVFHVRLRNEIYYLSQSWPLDSFNTNIDRSRKYGLEMQNVWRIDDRFRVGINYSWTRATIDREDQGDGAFKGKNLPGVSRHSLIASLGAKIGENGDLALSHTWRSKAYALEDFANEFSQKQRAYHSTDVSYRHRVSDDVVLFASVANVFDRSNGLWVRDDVIYPVDFTRTWRVGANISF